MRIRITEPNRRALTLAREEIALGGRSRACGRSQAQAERRRMNAFAGRALTARALTGEQAHRSWHIARLNRTLSRGRGRRAWAWPSPMTYWRRHRPRPMRRRRRSIWSRRDMTALETGLAMAVHRRGNGRTEARFCSMRSTCRSPRRSGCSTGSAPPSSQSTASCCRATSRAAARVARRRPAGAARRRHRARAGANTTACSIPTAPAALSQCERDLEAEAFDDEVRQESARLVYYAWPDEWLPLPAADLQWRNRLAWASLRARGALVASHRPAMVADRRAARAGGVQCRVAAAVRRSRAVARRGGAPRARPALSSTAARASCGRRASSSWPNTSPRRAQLGSDTAALATMLRYLPPAGLLPRDAMRRARAHDLAVCRRRCASTPRRCRSSSSTRCSRIQRQRRADRPGGARPTARAGAGAAVAFRARPAGGRAGRRRRRIRPCDRPLRRRARRLVAPPAEPSRESARAGVALDGPNVPAVPSPREDPLRLEDERIASAAAGASRRAARRAVARRRAPALHHRCALAAEARRRRLAVCVCAA